jgi:hypothetical protein
MKPALLRITSVVLSVLMIASPIWATCGGGGGGGMGGMRGATGGGMDSQQTYMVPWKVTQPDAPAPAAGLMVYWFPASQEELQKSSLRNSRTLSLYAAQCITMGVADAGTALGQKLPMPSFLSRCWYRLTVLCSAKPKARMAS